MESLLEALDCPFASIFNPSLRSDIVKLVSWLEDRKIREMEIHERESLKAGGTGFIEELNKYLIRINCPYTATDNSSSSSSNSSSGGSDDNSSMIKCINWLVSYAISVEYEDCADDCKDFENDNNSTGSGTGTGGSGNMEVDDNNTNIENDTKIDQLGSLVGITRTLSPTPEDSPSLLQRIARKIRLSLSSGSIEILKQHLQQSSSSSNTSSGGSTCTYTLDDFPLGIQCDDKTVADVMKVFKMLHLFGKYYCGSISVGVIITVITVITIINTHIYYY